MMKLFFFRNTIKTLSLSIINKGGFLHLQISLPFSTYVFSLYTFVYGTFVSHILKPLSSNQYEHLFGNGKNNHCAALKFISCLHLMDCFLTNAAFACSLTIKLLKLKHSVISYKFSAFSWGEGKLNTYFIGVS